MDLAPAEIRVLGCLLEKQLTTPDAYPLRLNALRLACNQATNRDPVVDYDDRVIRDALHRLERRAWVRLASGPGSRAAKYRHLLPEALPLGRDEQAVMCVLMLHGPQTLGELKQRSERMHAFEGLDDVEATLRRLTDRALVRRHERRPGQKEQRYTQLLGADHDGAALAPPPAGEAARAGPVTDTTQVRPPFGPDPGTGSGREQAAAATPSLEERVARLEREVARLRAAMDR